jgi:hypothetical protein
MGKEGKAEKATVSTSGVALLATKAAHAGEYALFFPMFPFYLL